MNPEMPKHLKGQLLRCCFSPTFRVTSSGLLLVDFDRLSLPAPGPFCQFSPDFQISSVLIDFSQFSSVLINFSQFSQL